MLLIENFALCLYLFVMCLFEILSLKTFPGLLFVCFCRCDLNNSTRFQEKINDPEKSLYPVCWSLISFKWLKSECTFCLLFYHRSCAAKG